MAEIIYQNLESMLPELEDITEKEVLSDEEIRTIIKRRTEFEYKLRKRITAKQDVMMYLDYEMKFYRLLIKRMKRLKLKYLSSPAILSVRKRILDIFHKATMKFSDDMGIWMRYLQFCKKSNSLQAMGKALGKMLRIHGSNPDAWIMAAKFEFEENGKIDSARSMMQKGLRTHGKSKKLWHEYFRLELMHVQKIRKKHERIGEGGIMLKNENEPEPVEISAFMENATAKVVFQKACDAIPGDIGFQLKFLKICENVDNKEGLEELIVQSLMDEFPSDERIVKLEAMQPISKLLGRLKNNIVRENEWIEAENQCTEIFEKHLASNPTMKMWSVYIVTLIELLKSSKFPDHASRRMATLTKALTQCEECDLMSAEMYCNWADLLYELDLYSESLDCLRRGLKRNKQCMELWKKFFSVIFDTTDEWNNISADLKLCLNSITKDEDKCVVWEMVFDLACSCDPEDIDDLLEDLLMSTGSVIGHAIPKYLTWLLPKKGIKAARKLFKRLQKNSFLSLPVLKAFIEAETSQEVVDCSRVRKLYSKATLEFGSSDAEIWLNWIQFENAHANTDVNVVGEVYVKARRALPDDLASFFTTQYVLLKNGGL